MVGHAAAVTVSRGAALHVVHVWTEQVSGALRRLGHHERRPGREDAERLLARATDRLAGRHPGLRVTRTVVRGRPAWSLLELSDSSQLVVVGRGPRHGLRSRPPGSCPSTLVQAAACPVAVVPPPTGSPRPWPVDTALAGGR